MAKQPDSKVSDLHSSTSPQEMVQPAKRTRTDSLCSCPVALKGRYSKTPGNPWVFFFPLCHYRKGHASNLLRLDKGQADRDGCTASGLFGKPGCVCVCCYWVFFPIYPLILRLPSSLPGPWLCSTAANALLEKKKSTEGEKTKYFLISLSPVRPHGFFILLGRHRELILIFNSAH